MQSDPGYEVIIWWSDEDRVHVEAPDGELKVWLEPRIEVAQNHGVAAREVTKYFALSKSVMAKSSKGGATTTGVEVVSIGKHGFWFNIKGRELFLAFPDFPWFADAAVRQILNVRLPSPDHLYWPDLDVDLSLESIEHPERFPLRFDPSEVNAS